MDAAFWTELWDSGRTGFHRAEPSPELIAHHDAVLGGADRVLVPLCGRTPDLAWLAPRHREVVGIEFVETAVTGYAAANGLAEAEGPAGFRAFRRDGLTVLLGDFFAADARSVGSFDGVWDRAALMALDPASRPRYARHCQQLLAPAGRILLELMELNQPADAGPPYLITEAEIRRLYAAHAVTVLAERPAADRIGRTYAIGPRA